MKIYNNPERAQWAELLKRPAQDDSDIRGRVRDIMEDVRLRGDRAVKAYTQKFDGPALAQQRVGPQELDEAAAQVAPGLKAAITQAVANIERFHAAQRPKEIAVETQPGLRCWQKPVPVPAVGIYIPGGTAPLFSTVLMLAIPARIAGCPEIVMTTPPGKDGNVHPAILYAAQVAGVKTIIKAGGVQAIAAMTYGTAEVPQVDKIFGPGNQYVTLAKQFAAMQGKAIDMPAGPSEVMVVADETTPPEFAAADLLSQAEHGADSQVVLVVQTQAVAQKILEILQKQLNDLPRKEIAQQALAHSRVFVLSDKAQQLDVINFYAPEHLILAGQDAQALAAGVVNAGSVFVGQYTPESLGDYASGTNHVLPTNGFARAFSGVNLDSFYKKITFQQASPEALNQIAPHVEIMAATEQLEAHRLAVALRKQAVGRKEN